MSLDWHERFVQQARWTKSVRDYLLQDVDFSVHPRVLEVGCGSGAVLSEISNIYQCKAFGIDSKLSSAKMAMRKPGFLNICTSDAAALPFPSDTFELVFCHYFLLWVKNPQIILGEVLRVLKSGGLFLAFAEPDYSNRVDIPQPLIKPSALQAQSLRLQGSNPDLGKDLAKLVANSGFQVMKFGVPGYEKPDPGVPTWWQSEWQVITNDLSDMMSCVELEDLKELDRQSWLSGERVLWVPTYYAEGRKP